MTTSGMTAPGAAAAWGKGGGREGRGGEVKGEGKGRGRGRGGRGGYGIIAFVSSGGGKVLDMPNCLNTVTADAQTHTNVQIRLSIHSAPFNTTLKGRG